MMLDWEKFTELPSGPSTGAKLNWLSASMVLPSAATEAPEHTQSRFTAGDLNNR